MLEIALVIAATIVGGMGFWLRGSSLFYKLTGRGATTARIVCWALPLALLSLFVVDPIISVAIGVALFAGSVLPWWSSLSLGRNPADGTFLQAAIRHTARGFCWTFPVSVVVWYAGGVWLLPLIAGLLVVVPYELGWRFHSEKFGATEYGEVGYGVMIGFALMTSLVLI